MFDGHPKRCPSLIEAQWLLDWLSKDDRNEEKKDKAFEYIYMIRYMRLSKLD